MKLFSYRLPEELERRLAKAAEELGVTKSEILRESLEKHLAEHDRRQRKPASVGTQAATE